MHGLPLARLGLDVALRNDSPAEFFAALERARAVSTRLARVAPPSDERTAALLTELRRSEQEARDRQGDPGAGEELARLRSRIAGLQREVRARAWELEGRTGAPAARSARVAEVRQRARELGTAFASYVVHDGRWRAVLASAGRPRLLDLAGAAEVEELVQRVRADLDALAMPLLPAPLLDAVRRSLEVGLRRLDDLLVAPLGVDGTPLVVSASAALALMPWSLLPSRRGLPVVVTPGATAWLRVGSGPRRVSPRVVAVAGPGLHRAGAEAADVGGVWPGAVLLTGEQARTAPVREALAGADLVHVGGARHPPAGEPAVLLAPAGRRPALRLRAGRRRARGPVRGAVRLRGGPGDRASRGRGARPDQRAAAPRVPLGAGRRRPGAGRRGRGG